jgi:hypothetical protein
MDKIKQIQDRKGEPHNNSEGVRQALYDFLKNEPKLMEELSCVSLQ